MKQCVEMLDYKINYKNMSKTLNEAKMESLKDKLNKSESAVEVKEVKVEKKAKKTKK